MDEWRLTPRGFDFVKSNFQQICEMLGLDLMILCINKKFAAKDWILVENNNQVDVWSLIENKTVTSLDESIIHRFHDIDGKLIPPNEAVLEIVGLKFVSSRDSEDKEITDAGIKLKPWLSTLDIPEDVRDGSCIENWLKQN